MHLYDFKTLALSGSFGLLAASAAVAAPPSVLKVTLFDQGAGTQMATGLGMAMAGADMKKATMHVAAEF